jgi:hypothetical protein
VRSAKALVAQARITRLAVSKPLICPTLRNANRLILTSSLAQRSTVYTWFRRVTSD